MSLKLKGSAAVVECLKRESVRFVFGVPGGQILSILDALHDTPEIRFITARDECGAACMADAYARITGQIGVCIATTGPGTTNLLTGVGGAMRDSSPVLVLTGNNRSEHLQRDDNQEADHINLLRGLTKWNFLAIRAEQIPWSMREAFRRALGGCPGPVHLDFGRDALEDELVEFTPLNPVQYRSTNRVEADIAAIETAAAHLIKARTPVIWAGRGVRVANANKEILMLADQMQIPIITTYNGIGSVPNTHPLVFGSRFRHGSRLTADILKNADLLLLVGNSMNAASTSRWKENLTDNILQIDIDPYAIGRHYPITMGITGDAKAVVKQLLQSLDETVVPNRVLDDRRSRIADLKLKKAKWREDVFSADLKSAVPIKPQFLMRTLSEVMPDKTIFVAGAGNPGIWTNLLEIREAGTYIKPVGFGNMGFALPAAVGAKLARPERPVACIIGDGSLGMCISEIETAVRENTPMVIVVMNNLSYGNIKQEQLVHYGPRYIGVDFTDVDYAMIAKGFGADGCRIDNPTMLTPALEKALDSQKPYLLDIRIDPDEDVWIDPF